MIKVIRNKIWEKQKEKLKFFLEKSKRVLSMQILSLIPWLFIKETPKFLWKVSIKLPRGNFPVLFLWKEGTPFSTFSPSKLIAFQLNHVMAPEKMKNKRIQETIISWISTLLLSERVFLEWFSRLRFSPKE